LCIKGGKKNTAASRRGTTGGIALSEREATREKGRKGRKGKLTQELLTLKTLIRLVLPDVAKT